MEKDSEYFIRDLTIDDEYDVINSESSVKDAALKMKELGIPDLVVTDNENKVLEVHVRYAQNKIEQDRVSLVLKTLPIHSKLVLCSIYLLHKAAVENVITGDVYEVYSKICNDLNMEPLTQRRVSGLINELDITGIVNARLVNFGRYGRTKKIRLGVSTSIITSAFSDDSLVEKVLTYSPSFLNRSLKSGS